MKKAFLCLLLLSLFAAGVSQAEIFDGSLLKTVVSYQAGNYVYYVPENWNTEEIGSTRHHRTEDGLFYSVSLMANPVNESNDITSTQVISDILNRIPQLIKNPSIETVTAFGEIIGCKATGESAITEDTLINALFLVNDPGYIQFVYSNPEAADQSKEFEQLVENLYLRVDVL